MGQLDTQWLRDHWKFSFQVDSQDIWHIDKNRQLSKVS